MLLYAATVATRARWRVCWAGVRVNVAITSPPYASQREYDKSSGFPAHPAGTVRRVVPAGRSQYRGGAGGRRIVLSQHQGACRRWRKKLVCDGSGAAHKRQWGWRFVDEFCWRNTANGVPGGWPNRFKNAWEPVFHFTQRANHQVPPKGCWPRVRRCCRVLAG